MRLTQLLTNIVMLLIYTAIAVMLWCFAIETKKRVCPNWPTLKAKQ